MFRIPHVALPPHAFLQPSREGERAIVQACEDIREQPSLAGAEILVVTDGAARLREDRIETTIGP